MTNQQAVSLIESGIENKSGTWADIGAGTGAFTLALREILTEGKIIAVDKSPHALWRLPLKGNIPIEIVEGDFNNPLDLPPLDGILMANTLHYAKDPISVLKNLLKHLKPKAPFILVEYQTDHSLPPWIPFPVPMEKFVEMATASGLSVPVEISRVPSQYGHQYIYGAIARKY